MTGASATVLAVRARPARVSAIIRVTGATGRVVDLGDGWVGFVPEDPQDLGVLVALPTLRSTADGGHEPALRLSRSASGTSLVDVAGPAAAEDGSDNIVGWQWHRAWVVVGAGEAPAHKRQDAHTALLEALAPDASPSTREELHALLADEEPVDDPLVRLCTLLDVPATAVTALDEGPRPPRRGWFRRR